MNCDQVPADERDDTIMFCDESPSLDASMNARGLIKAGSMGPGKGLFAGFKGTSDDDDDVAPANQKIKMNFF